MSDFTIRTSTTPPATVKVQADPSFSTKQAVEAAEAAALSAAAADADAVATAADRVQTGLDAAATAADRVQTGLDAAQTAQDVIDASNILASSLKIDQNLADLDDATVALTNLGLTATAAEINTLDGITASTAELNLLDGATVTTAQINSIAQFTGRNLIINGSGRINQRGYVSGTATSGANQFTLDRWFVITSGQSLSFTGNDSARVMTAPAGGVSQVIEGANIVGGTYVLNWTGTATATVGGVARTKGETFTLTANTNVTVTFASGTFSEVQFEAGSIVTPFERRTFGQELALCQRYYWRGLPAANLNFPAYASSAVMAWPVTFPVTLRAVPVLASDFTGATLDGVNTPTWTNPSADAGRFILISTGANTNANISFVAGNFIAADAELTS